MVNPAGSDISRSPVVFALAPVRLSMCVDPLANVMTSTAAPEPAAQSGYVEPLLLALIIASRREHPLPLVRSSVVLVTVMVAAKAGCAGIAPSAMAMIARAAKNLYGTEEKIVVRMLYPFNSVIMDASM